MRLSGRVAEVLALARCGPPFPRAVARALARARSGATVSWAGEPRIAREMAARSWSTSSCEGVVFRRWGATGALSDRYVWNGAGRRDGARATHLGEREVECGLRPPADRAMRARCLLDLPPFARGLGRSQRLAVHPTRELRPEEAGGDVLRVEVVQEVHRGEGPRRASTARSSLCCTQAAEGKATRAREVGPKSTNIGEASSWWTTTVNNDSRATEGEHSLCSQRGTTRVTAAGNLVRCTTVRLRPLNQMRSATFMGISSICVE